MASLFDKNSNCSDNFYTIFDWSRSSDSFWFNVGKYIDRFTNSVYRKTSFVAYWNLEVQTFLLIVGSTSVSKSVLDWRLLLLVGVVLAAAFYQVMFPGPTYFRTWCCCYGAMKPIRMVEFDFTTMDFQVSTLNFPYLSTMQRRLETWEKQIRFNVTLGLYRFIR